MDIVLQLLQMEPLNCDCAAVNKISDKYFRRLRFSLHTQAYDGYAGRQFLKRVLFLCSLLSGKEQRTALCHTNIKAMNGHHENGLDAAEDLEGMQYAAVDPSRIIEIQLQTSELLEINLDELRDDDTVNELADLFTNEQCPVKFWVKLLNEYHRRGSVEKAIHLGERGIAAFKSRGDENSTIQLLCMLASYAMQHSRSAPKTVLQAPRQYKVKQDPKTMYFNKATSYITQAEQIQARNGFVLDTKGILNVS